MKLVTKCAIYFTTFLSNVCISQCLENNVCSTLKDYNTIKNNPNCWYDFSADSNVTEIISKYGYTVETHKVTTPDGYILTLFRISNHHVKLQKGPVFLQHGLLCSSANFVGLGKDSLTFILTDAGYDVWLGNFRGSDYSEEHVNLTVYDKKYWDYSADEIGLYDIPTQLEYVAQNTGQRGNIVYIGHSLGASSALIYSSSFPEDAKNTTKLFVLLAPAARIPNMIAPILRILAPYYGNLLDIFNQNNLIRQVSQGKVLRQTMRLACLQSAEVMQRCMQMFNLLILGPSSQVQPKTLPVLFNQLPAGSSFKITLQLGEAVRNHFRPLSHGRKTHFPAIYNFSKIEVPIFVIYSAGDWLTGKQDSLNLYKSLPFEVKYGIKEVDVLNFNHLDFLYGKDARSHVYDRILNVLDKIS